MRRRKNGFTLVELLVTLAIFTVLAGSILATFAVSAGYWNSGNAQNDIKEGVRLGFQTIQAEMMQSSIDTDPGASNTSTGYLGINPPLSDLQPPYNAPTGILLPNANTDQQTSSEVLFNEVNAANCAAPCWAPGSNPFNYLQVEYFVSNGVLQRQQTSYTATGSVASTRTDTVVEIKNGTLQMQATYSTAYSLDLQITAQENGRTYSLTSQVFSPGSETY